MILAIGATHIEAFGDSLLVVRQVVGAFKCFDGSLNTYLDECLDIIATLDYFSIAHVSRYNNWKANNLAQQASIYHVSHGMFHVSHKPMSCFANMERAELKLIASASNEKFDTNPQSQFRIRDFRVADNEEKVEVELADLATSEKSDADQD